MRKERKNILCTMYFQEKPLPMNFDIYFLPSYLSHNGKDNLSPGILLGKL